MSSSAHCVNGSQTTGQASSTPKRSLICEPVLIRGDGGDPVDHGVGESDSCLDPFAQLRVPEPGERGENFLCHMTIALDVVARHHREGLDAARAPPYQGFGYQTKRRRGHSSGSQISLDGRILRVEFTGDRMEVVAPFGHGERNDPRGRVSHLLNYGVRVVRRVQVLHDRSDDPRLPASVRGFLNQREETVLGLHRLLHLEVEWHHADATDSPVQCLALVHEPIEVHRLVGSVEPTYAEVHDAHGDLRAVVARHWNREGSEAGLIQRSHLTLALT